MAVDDIRVSGAEGPGHGLGYVGLGEDDPGAVLLDLGPVLGGLSGCHGPAFLRFCLEPPFVGLGLVELELGADVLTDAQVRHVDPDNYCAVYINSNATSNGMGDVELPLVAEVTARRASK